MPTTIRGLGKPTKAAVPFDQEKGRFESDSSVVRHSPKTLSSGFRTYPKRGLTLSDSPPKGQTPFRIGSSNAKVNLTFILQTDEFCTRPNEPLSSPQ